MKRTLDQNRHFHRLISQLGIDAEAKEALVFQFSARSSSADMHQHEMAALIKHLIKLTPEDKMRKKIISIAYDLGWTIDNGNKVDLSRINAFLKSPKSIFKKHLNAHSKVELTHVVTQFERMLGKHLDKNRNGKQN